MSNFKMINNIDFLLKLELQLGMPENQIIQKPVQCFRLGKCLLLKGPQWELTAVLRSGQFLQVTRHTSHPRLKHPPVVRIHILISVYCLGINDPRVLHTTFMVKIEVQEDKKYWNDHMVFIWYKTIQHRNYVKNEFNVAKHHHSSK